MAEIPLFPLGTVLLPGGRMQLKIFEQRYLSMITNVMREETGFGMVMISSGYEVLEGRESDQQPNVEPVGSFIKVVDFTEGQAGMLLITIEAEVKLKVARKWSDSDRLMMGQVEFLTPEEDQAVTPEFEHLADLLGHLMQYPAIASLFESFDYTSACGVGGRLTEFLPCSELVKQGLLEMTDPIERLVQLDRIVSELQERGGGLPAY